MFRQTEKGNITSHHRPATVSRARAVELPIPSSLAQRPLGLRHAPCRDTGTGPWRSRPYQTMLYSWSRRAESDDSE